MTGQAAEGEGVRVCAWPLLPLPPLRLDTRLCPVLERVGMTGSVVVGRGPGRGPGQREVVL